VPVEGLTATRSDELARKYSRYFFGDVNN